MEPSKPWMSPEESFNFWIKEITMKSVVSFALCLFILSNLEKLATRFIYSLIYKAVKYVCHCPGHALTLNSLQPSQFFMILERIWFVKLDRQTGTKPFSLYVLACKKKLKLNLFLPMHYGSQNLYAFFCPVHAQTIQETCNSFYCYFVL
jgi:hypothetical protein